MENRHSRQWYSANTGEGLFCHSYLWFLSVCVESPGVFYKSKIFQVFHLLKMKQLHPLSVKREKEMYILQHGDFTCTCFLSALLYTSFLYGRLFTLKISFLFSFIKRLSFLYEITSGG